MNKHAVFGILFALCCATAPNARGQTTANSDRGKAVAGCKDVPVAKRVSAFRTDSYLTTVGSVFAEALMPGVSSGLNEGLSEAGAMRGYQAAGGSKVLGDHLPTIGARAGSMLSEKIHKPADFDGLPVFLLPSQPKAFCRTYGVSRVLVVAAVGDTMRALGIPLKANDYKKGIFETEFVKRQRREAVWIERYRITVEDAQSGVVVKVKRQVFRGRNPTIGGDDTPALYTQGISSGHNETWILTQLSDAVQKSN